MRTVSILQHYVDSAMRHHAVFKPMGAAGTTWAGVDFTRTLGVIAPSLDEATQELHEALAEWVAWQLRNGDEVPIIEGIDLNTPEARRLVSEQFRIVTDPDQAWFWTPEWQAGEREAGAQIDAGRTEFFESEEDFLARCLPLA